MKINIREDSVEVEGYVNAVERNSKPLWSRFGRFVERVCSGTFKKAIKENKNIRILLNHDEEKDLGGTADGNLELEEDNIGLHARATITNEEAVQAAKDGKFKGWSFGFKEKENGVEKLTDEVTGLPLRRLKDIILYEVSLLTNDKTPAYDGTLVNVRSDEEVIFRADMFNDDKIPDEIEIIKGKLTEEEFEKLKKEILKTITNLEIEELKNFFKEAKGE